MAVERSLILIKPDAVQRRLAGEILGRIEARGFEILEAKLVTAPRDLGEKHYSEHRDARRDERQWHPSIDIGVRRTVDDSG